MEDHGPVSEVDDSLGNFKPIMHGVEDFAKDVLVGWEDDGVVGAGYADYNWSGIIGMVSVSQFYVLFSSCLYITECGWDALCRRGAWQERTVDSGRV